VVKFFFTKRSLQFSKITNKSLRNSLSLPPLALLCFCSAARRCADRPRHLLLQKSTRLAVLLLHPLHLLHCGLILSSRCVLPLPPFLFSTGSTVPSLSPPLSFLHAARVTCGCGALERAGAAGGSGRRGAGGADGRGAGGVSGSGGARGRRGGARQGTALGASAEASASARGCGSGSAWLTASGGRCWRRAGGSSGRAWGRCGQHQVGARQRQTRSAGGLRPGKAGARGRRAGGGPGEQSARRVAARRARTQARERSGWRLRWLGAVVERRCARPELPAPLSSAPHR
jgi:hypothetical protein